MTKEEKNLLITDLCGRLPYGVICKFTDTFDGCEVDNVLHPDDITDMFRHRSHCGSRIDAKPYLRPMSSMTEEERKSLPFPWNFDGINITSYTKENGFIEIQQTDIIELTDWLNKKMFDYRGLIDKGLAIEVTEENNPYKD